MSAPLVFVHVLVDQIEIIGLPDAEGIRHAKAFTEAGVQPIWPVKVLTGASKRSFQGTIVVTHVEDHLYTTEDDITFLFNGKKFLMTVRGRYYHGRSDTRAVAIPIE